MEEKTCIQIRYSDSNTSEELIYELMSVEADAYSPEYRGEFESIRQRFLKFKDMFILAYDGDKLIGYLCYFPISRSLHDEVLFNHIFHDDDIESNDVMAIGKRNYIYLISICLIKAYQKKGIGQELMNAFLEKLKEYNSCGNTIVDVLAAVVTEAGEGIAKVNGMSEICDETLKDYKLFVLSGDKLC